VELDEAVDGLGAADVGASAVEVGEERLAPLLEPLAEPPGNRPGGQVGLRHPEGLLDVSQVVVARDHLTRWHQGGLDVGDVALQPHEVACPGQ
jgi:hypothetical protein